MKHKQGQTSLFIILGILMLVGLGMYFYMAEEATTDTLDVTTDVATIQYPVEISPITTFIDSCLGAVSDDAIIKIGKYGGYLDSEDLASDGTGIALQRDPLQGTNAEGIAITQNSQMIPFWHYKHGAGGCGDDCPVLSKKPALTADRDPQFSMEAQLERYILQELKACVSDFTEFKEAGYVFSPKQDARVDVHLSDEVFVQLSMPHTVSKDDARFEFSEFVHRTDIDLGDMYAYAEEIVAFERSYEFFERGTNTIISAHTGLSENKLPPTAAYGENGDKKIFWQKTDVEKNVQALITQYIPLAQVDSSMNYQERIMPNLPYLQGMLKRLVMPLNAELIVDEVALEDPEATNDDIFSLEYSSQGFRPYNVEFSYIPTWPMYFDIEGQGITGNVIKPHVFGMFVNIVPFESIKYNYYYDVSYPLVVSIYDPFALDGNGYEFRFALEVNMVDNARRFFEMVDDEGNSIAPDRDGSSTLLCKSNQLTQGPVRVRTIDGRTGQALEDVDIKFACGDTCALGYTSKYRTIHSELETPVPACLGGTLVGMKFGYKSARHDIDTYHGADITRAPISLKLYPDQELTVSLEKYPRMMGALRSPDKNLKVHDWIASTSPKNFNQYEFAYVNIEEVDPNPGEFSLPNFFVYNGSTQEYGTVNLHPGTYKVTIDSYYGAPVRVPPRCIVSDDGFFGLGSDFDDIQLSLYDPTRGEQCITAMESPVGSIVCSEEFGGDECTYINSTRMEILSLGTTTYEIEVSDQVYLYNHVVLPVMTSMDGFDTGITPDHDPTRLLTLGDLSLVGDLESFMATHSNLLSPKFARTRTD